MTFGDIIFKLFIGPLELFFEVVFVIANRFVHNPAYAIIMLSLAMNFLVLPLYRRADALQAEERDRENAMKPWMDHIKKTFKGDERFMMLQTFYRQNNYKPTDSLKGSISLVLEIPFFIAAYHFLSNLETLRGVSFGPLADLGAPDALIHIGALTLNLLPILMTLINVISAAIYMKGFPLKSKIQMYGIAVIFLIFLYKSPAGLVFYWTLNNIFSLVKNIFYKLKNPAGVLRVMASGAGIIMLAFVLFIHPMRSMRTQCIVILCLLMLQLPLAVNFLAKRGISYEMKITEDPDKLFYASCLLMTVLTGLLIPSAVLNGSVEEFIDVHNFFSPAWYIVSALALAAGTFLIWCGIFYRLASEQGKQIMSLLFAAAAAAGLMDYMFFGKNYGNFSADLEFDNAPEIGLRAMAVNLAAVAAVAAVIYVLWRYKRVLVTILAVASCIALIGMSVVNITGISGEIKDVRDRLSSMSSSTGMLHFSRNGKNVVVLMMDRQIGYLVPYLVNEDPHLKEQFDGFTLYRNTISYGIKTNFGSPGLYGGYDYTPERLNERDQERLVDKHNESLKVMPELFGGAGYDVTIVDPTYAGYTWIPDISIYDDHPEYNVFLKDTGFDLPEYGYEAVGSKLAIEGRLRNFFCYGLFKVSPAVLQQTLYEHGNYNAQKKSGGNFPQEKYSRSRAHGFDREFMENYAYLKHIDEVTDIEDEGYNFLMMSNDMTHESMVLKMPEYVPALDVHNSKYDKAHPDRTDEDGNVLSINDKKTLAHYETNMLAMRVLGDWMDSLKEQGVYDNTRIIIVSDHGHDICYRDNRQGNLYSFTDDAGVLKECNVFSFSSVLLVKDFNSEGFTISDTVTTNADVPAMALRGIVDDPVNPFTGNRITTYQEAPQEINVMESHDWSVNKNNGNVFLPADWFRVTEGDLMDVRNWEYTGTR